MNSAIRLLLVPYRDLLIDELQLLKTRGNYSFSDSVQGVMSAAMERRARSKESSKGFFGVRPVSSDPDEVEPCDLFLLEATLIQHLDHPSELILRLVTLRELLGSLLTPASYAELEQHLLVLPRPDRRVPTANTLEQKEFSYPVDALKAEAIALSSRLYRRIGGLPEVEKIRTAVACRICGSTLVILAFSAALATLHMTPYGALEVACWGAVGSMVSTVERLYRVDPMHEPLKTALTLSAGLFQLELTPLIGAIFALVLYLLLRGNFVNGVLFPNIPCAEILSRSEQQPGSIAFSIPEACSRLQPGIELGKLLVWGYLAGWAERMVPDVLNKLAPQPSGALKTGKFHAGRFEAHPDRSQEHPPLH